MKSKIIILVLFVLISSLSAQTNVPEKKNEYLNKAMVTFVELGSVNCIPCKKMQIVMKAIEEKYGEQVKVIFYDIWTDEQKKYADQYNIRLIPTQVFLDKDGDEFFRHEGFFPEAEIEAILQQYGLSPLKKKD